jgi:glycosyltransferase involved in cell wall biosynthesis
MDGFVEPFLKLSRPVIISVGRLNWQKAYDNLITAFSELPNDLRGSLVIMGEGELLEELRDYADRLGVGDKVHFPGFVKNPWWYMSQSELFVSSSVWEGFGLVLAEAMACGLPVVSTDSPGPAEVVEPGVSGVLVPVGDASQLSAEMLRCLTDEGLRTSLKAGGLRRVQHFLPKTMHDEYMQLIDDVWNGGQND